MNDYVFAFVRATTTRTRALFYIHAVCGMQYMDVRAAPNSPPKSLPRTKHTHTPFPQHKRVTRRG